MDEIKSVKSELCLDCFKISDIAYSVTECGHYVCSNCWDVYFMKEMRNVNNGTITCPVCDEIVTFHNAQSIFLKINSRQCDLEKQKERRKFLENYEESLSNQFLLTHNLYSPCPKICGYGVFGGDDCAKCPQIICEKCPDVSYCYNCGKIDCDCKVKAAPERPRATRNQRPFLLMIVIRLIFEHYTSFITNTDFKSLLDSLRPVRKGMPLKKGQIIRQTNDFDDRSEADNDEIKFVGRAKRCPHCKMYMLKESLSNLIRCTKCSTSFCWLCNRRAGIIHFKSVFGCGIDSQSRKSLLYSVGILCLLMLGFPLIAIGELIVGVLLLWTITHTTYTFIRDLAFTTPNLSKNLYKLIFIFICILCTPLIFVVGSAITLLISATLIYVYFPFVILFNIPVCNTKEYYVYETFDVD